MTAPDLARRLVDHPRWPGYPLGIVGGSEYGPGSETVQRVADGYINTASERGPWLRYPVSGGRFVLDINHPATKGWLLHMLREATGDGEAFCSWREGPGTWLAYADGLGAYRDHHPTEGEAIAAALLAVWGAS